MAKAREHKKLRKLTAKRIENIALHYLGRYASTEAHLARILENRVGKHAYKGGDVPHETGDWIRAVVQKAVRLELVDDRAYARGRLASLRLKGFGKRRIRADLRHKGVPPEIIDEAMTEEGADDEDEFGAALRFARRRRLGPYRLEGTRNIDPAKIQQRALGALARAGFDYAVAKRILELDLEEAEALMYG